MTYGSTVSVPAGLGSKFRVMVALLVLYTHIICPATGLGDRLGSLNTDLWIGLLVMVLSTQISGAIAKLTYTPTPGWMTGYCTPNCKPAHNLKVNKQR